MGHLDSSNTCKSSQNAFIQKIRMGQSTNCWPLKAPCPEGAFATAFRPSKTTSEFPQQCMG